MAAVGTAPSVTIDIKSGLESPSVVKSSTTVIQIIVRGCIARQVKWVYPLFLRDTFPLQPYQ
jgi:hypothetical protein